MAAVQNRSHLNFALLESLSESVQLAHNASPMQTLRAALAVVQVLVNLVAFIASIVAYIRRNDHTITSIPHSAISLSPTRWTEGDIELVKQLHSETPLTIEEQLPPRTGRRYIVIGGVMFPFTIRRTRIDLTQYLGRLPWRIYRSSAYPARRTSREHTHTGRPTPHSSRPLHRACQRCPIPTSRHHRSCGSRRSFSRSMATYSQRQL